MISFPTLKSSLKQYRLTSAEAWSDRLTIWLAAVAAGLSIVGFSYLTEFALERFYHLRSLVSWAPLLITPLGAVTVVWLTRTFFPYAAGSGIPQVIVAMDTSVKPAAIQQLVSVPIAFAKCLLGSAALAFGFSTGRPQAIVAIGMVGFLAAVTQAPITSFIIVMEMIDGHAMVLSLMATALTSSAIARLISPSLYHSLALIMKQKLEAPIASDS